MTGVSSPTLWRVGLVGCRVFDTGLVLHSRNALYSTSEISKFSLHNRLRDSESNKYPKSRVLKSRSQKIMQLSFEQLLIKKKH